MNNITLVNGTAITSHCTTVYGDPDVTGIGVRIGVYICAAQLLFYYIVAEPNRSRASLWQLTIGNIAVHLVNIYYFRAGTLQPYTLAILMHLSLLMNLPSFVLFGRFSFRGFWADRWCFLTNFVWTFCELPFLIQGDFISRNLDLCQALVWEDHRFGLLWRTALGTQLAFHGLLLGYHFYTCYLDGRANAGKPNIALWKMIRPWFLMWKKNKWEPQRKVIVLFGFLLLVAGIVVAEGSIASFTETASTAISTKENQIVAYGQLLPVVATGLPCLTGFWNSCSYIQYTYRWYDTLLKRGKAPGRTIESLGKSHLYFAGVFHAFFTFIFYPFDCSCTRNNRPPMATESEIRRLRALDSGWEDREATGYDGTEFGITHRMASTA